MGSIRGDESSRGHAVCIPFPAQGHINPMLHLAKLLHHRGFRITFVNTEHNHRRLLKSGGPAALAGLSDFRFAAIPDGLPPSDPESTQDIPSLCVSTSTTCLEPFCKLLSELNGEGPPVSVIVSDGVMSFTLKAAERFRLPEVLFWTTSACGFLGYTQYPQLVEKGYVPLKEQVTNGHMETVIDWFPAADDFRLRDFPSFIRTTDPKDIMLNFFLRELEAIPKPKAVIMNTFEALESDVLKALSRMFNPKIYSIGPLHLMMNQIHDERLNPLSSSLWKQDSDCIKWLDSKEPESVFYVNFGSITVMTPEHLSEFAWGLANSKKPFLWVIRPDIIAGDTAVLPPEFAAETGDRSLVISWCPQEKVLKHPAVGGFLTHSGWNSTIESISCGVPMICWPFFAEQQTNCRYSCVEWEIGMEMDKEVKRDEVEWLVREVMDGEKGKKMKEKALEWKRKAEEATAAGSGSSYLNFDKLIQEALLQ
ncbi:7-deoxyloganetin glucosyltransferase-like isoform X2 [Henckelia pumila]|uniref:7-deoxyloganetin glucosyltransferase-like isoform X2 n=1 Tax=Henckelia pumila TaxID=405737 RepID=UPI003C6E6306